MVTRRIAVAAAMFLSSTAVLFADTPDKFVRYVESTGSQYVDTGVIGRYNTKIEAQVEWMEFGDKILLGCGDWSDNTRFFAIYCLTGDGNIAIAQSIHPDNTKFAYVNDGTWNSWWQKDRIYDYSAEFGPMDGDGKSTTKVVVDGIASTNFTTAAANTCYNMYLFGYNKKGSVGGYTKGRIYRLKIWQGPAEGGDMVLVRDFIPCMKGGKAGLFDAKSGEICFAIGGDLLCDENSCVPDKYVDYVESTGTCYIDTEVEAKSGTSAECDVAVLHKNTLRLGLLGASKGSVYFDLVQAYEKYLSASYGPRGDLSTEQFSINTRYRVVSSLAVGEQTLTMQRDGTEGTVSLYSGTDETAIETGLSLYLFGRNADGEINGRGRYKLYGCKISQNGVLVRDFRPCLKDGAFALYDEVSKRIFHPKRGLLNGPLQSEKAAAKKLVFVEYIESTGNETLDTGIAARYGTRAKGEFCWTEDFSSLDKRYEIGRYLKGPIYKDARTFLGADDPTYWPTFFQMVYASEQCFAGYYGNGLGNNSVAYGGWAKNGSDYIYAKTPLEKHSFDVSFMNGEQTITLDGTQVWSLSNDRNFDTGRNLHIFSSGSRYRSAARCYGLEVWQDGVKVRDFKPCIYDGKAMLYDTVTDSVYRPSPDIPASKTGSIVSNPDAVPEYFLDYVESDGTIFVDTGVTGKSGTKADLKMRFLEKDDKGFLDSRNGGTRFYMWHNYTKENLFAIGYSEFQSFGSSGSGKTDYDYTVSSSLFAGSQTVTVNGQTWDNINFNKFVSLKNNTYDTGLNLYLFAMHQDGNPTYAGKARLYYLKLYQGGTDGSDMRMVRNFIPVRLSNGLTALYDLITHAVYMPQLVSSPGTYVDFPSCGDVTEKFYEYGLMIIVR